MKMTKFEYFFLSLRYHKLPQANDILHQIQSLVIESYHYVKFSKQMELM